MNLVKKKYLRSRREAVVKFIDDDEVTKISSNNKFETGKVKDATRKNTKSKVPKDNQNNFRSKKNEIPDEIIECDISSDDENVSLKKPVSLFEEGDVPGKAVFGFQTPKRKTAMADKVAESAGKVTPNNKLLSTPKTPASSNKSTIRPNTCTPKSRKSISLQLNSFSPGSTKKGKKEKLQSSSKLSVNENSSGSVIVPKTPYSLRARLKKKISAKIVDASDSDEDLIPSDSEDDYDDDGSNDSSDENISDNERNISNDDSQGFSKIISGSARGVDKRENKKFVSNQNFQKRKIKDLTYAFKVDDYFNSSSGKKNKTSNHTLKHLKNPKLAQDQLGSLLSNVARESSHYSSLKNLTNESYLQDLFNKWCFWLKEGFSILLYGLGSKCLILNKFHQQILSNSHVFIVNGFFPGLTTKEIIDSVAGELLNIKDIPSQSHEVIELIEEKMIARGSQRIFILINNIDGVGLRSDKMQSLLARLASIPKCHLLASIDHINAPLLWDDRKLSEFNFIWEDVTNFRMYSEETCFENSLLVQQSSTLVLSSLKNVFQSLTKNGKEIFKIILEDCLTNKKNKKYVGIGFSDLYWRCRDNFLASTDLALRSQLTEFLDHQLVKWRKDSDHLIIPVDASVLEQFQKLLESEL